MDERMKKFVTLFILALTLMEQCTSSKVPTCNEIELMRAAIHDVVDGQISRTPNAVRFGKGFLPHLVDEYMSSDLEVSICLLDISITQTRILKHKFFLLFVSPKPLS